MTINVSFRILCLSLLFFIMNYAHADRNLPPAVTAPIPVTELIDYSTYSENVKNLISIATSLSEKKLTYLYGSSDPKNNGMDCSGTIYYLLKTAHVEDVPRSAEEMFSWAKEKGKLYPVTEQEFNSVQFSHLKPGDLLFWTGTYAATPSESGVTHVMIYLGKNKNKQPLMFGSSDGRTYQGKKMWGVSVFDFQLPNDNSKAKFVGYSCIPKLTCFP